MWTSGGMVLNFRRRSRAMLALLWAASLLLLPLLVWQGWRTRQTALHLPEAEPPDRGQFGQGESGPTVVGLGDSVIAGVGVQVLSESLTGSVARCLAERLDREVSWQTIGTNGYRLVDLLGRLKTEPVSPADIYLVSIGVNDVTGLTSLLRWQMQVIELTSILDNTSTLVLLGVPPMQYFTALPQPLRQVLGIRAALLDKTLQQVGALSARVICLETDDRISPGYLAMDGYHPSKLACLEMAGKIVDVLIQHREHSSP